MLRKKFYNWFLDLALLFVLLMGANFRITGLFWGEYTYMHPDERFLLMVGSSLVPVENLRDYFDTDHSTLNPHNRGYTFYVYGTFPLFLTRYTAEWVYDQIRATDPLHEGPQVIGMEELQNVGRLLSAFFDLLTIILAYLIAEHLYGRRVGLLAATFLACAVLPIQLSHFFKEDTFLNFFTTLAVYFALRIAVDPKRENSKVEDGVKMATLGKPLALTSTESILRRHWFDFIGFGIALGLAVACKLNTAPVALLLPVAVLIRLNQSVRLSSKQQAYAAVTGLFLAAVISLLIFRTFQPYAFKGPGFFDVGLNPKWIANISEQRSQAAGDVDFPPAMQWARRPVWFSGLNLIVWGLGIPLGIVAWSGFLWCGWQILRGGSRKAVMPEPGLFYPRGEWERHLVIWLWTGFYFTWQSLQFNPTMRYQLPIYPMLVIFAGWAIVKLWDKGSSAGASKARDAVLRRLLAFFVGSLVFVLTLAWAFAFLQVYIQPFTRVAASRWIFQNIPGPINLRIQTEEGIYNQPLPFQREYAFTSYIPYSTNFKPQKSGVLREVYVYAMWDKAIARGSKTVTLSIDDVVEDDGPLASATLSEDFVNPRGIEGEGYTFVFAKPLYLQPELTYRLTLSLDAPETSALTIQGATIANEGTWDDGLPLRVDGYDGFGGIYPPEVNFEMYWEDNAEKLRRFLGVLDQADYVLITSNRQWGSLPRIPERYPLVTAYYRYLLGCPPQKSISWCYSVAQPGMFTGDLGFELIQVFQTDPSLGRLRINDQFAEEAFTVYDHPKVLIFRKSKDYDARKVEDILSAVDLSHVMHITPKQALPRPMDLMLPSERLAEQRAGGTWAELFNPQALHNRYQPLGIIVWYLCLSILGLLNYPLTRLAFSGLADRGYPLVRIVGLLLLAYLIWLLGSYRVPFNRVTIGFALLMILVVNAYLAYWQRAELKQEWSTHKHYYLYVELLALLAFLFLLFVRWGNPDLWHPWKGGEKPMDFSYFNAVLKSTSFPPYDPWFAGGYINYYYYGFVVVGVLVKFLGILPSFAYNLILPTLFSLIVLGAFTLGWNLGAKHRVLTALGASIGVALLGNLGTWRMIFRGYQTLAAPGIELEAANWLMRWVWAVKGFMQVAWGASLPYAVADWYWLPSRVIAAQGDVEPITEFPYFTILYADLHAHLIALPVTLAALAWALSVVLGRGWGVFAKSEGAKDSTNHLKRSKFLKLAIGYLIGALTIGALRPTNTWDFPTYLVLGIAAVSYVFWSYLRESPFLQGSEQRKVELRIIGEWFLAVVLLVFLSFALYQPYSHWYALGYTNVKLWWGPRTPLVDYFTHWGLFLFLIVTWMFSETIHWMATTPLSSLRKLRPYQELIWGVAIVLLILTVALGIKLPGLQGTPFGQGVKVAWVALPLAAWAGVLLLRPNLPGAKRVILFLVGTGLVLTLVVEIWVLEGDIGRMNTVFKFYLQVWVLFAISAAAALGWLFEHFSRLVSIGNGRYSSLIFTWQLVLLVLILACGLYPWMATTAKIKDRMAPNAPHTLDGMAYMAYAVYADQGWDMNLSQDYRAIRWLQDNVKGSPVIVEANNPEYRWGTRYTIYTGLPGVVGWNWHQRQQRAVTPPEWVTNRINEILNFYTTENEVEARRFLLRYDVSYIILGQLERAYYPGPGLAKFPALDGILWKTVYQDGATTIYKVIR